MEKVMDVQAHDTSLTYFPRLRTNTTVTLMTATAIPTITKVRKGIATVVVVVEVEVLVAVVVVVVSIVKLRTSDKRPILKLESRAVTRQNHGPFQQAGHFRTTQNDFAPCNPVASFPFSMPQASQELFETIHALGHSFLHSGLNHSVTVFDCFED